MAKNNGKPTDIEKRNANYNQGIEEVNISEACTGYMQLFGANNNIMRHLPLVLDGTKLGERRLLFAMYKMGATPDKAYRKVANITGNTMGDYHPHGDTAIYDTLVRLAQSWSNIQCTVDGQGNFGNAAGEPAAAARYIEARLSKYAYKCFFEEFSEDLVDMKDTFDKTKKEPEFLPARYPNVMINNSFGIGLTN